jgi:hypothetical protein
MTKWRSSRVSPAKAWGYKRATRMRSETAD